MPPEKHGMGKRRTGREGRRIMEIGRGREKKALVVFKTMYVHSKYVQEWCTFSQYYIPKFHIIHHQQPIINMLNDTGRGQRERAIKSSEYYTKQNDYPSAQTLHQPTAQTAL